MSKQTMKQALDALELHTTIEGGYCSCCGHQPCLKNFSVIQAIIALRAALDAPEPYDQQALEPCNVCGWKAIVPGEPCLMCERNAKMLLPEPEPLSDERIVALVDAVFYPVESYSDYIAFARAIERKAKRRAVGPSV